MTKAVQNYTTPGNAGPLRLDFVNDVQGRRVQKMVSVLTSQGLVLQSSTTTLYDGWRPVQDIDFDGNGQVTATRVYTWGPDVSGSLDGAAGVGGLLEIKETINGVTTLSVPIEDGNGNICGLVDEQSGALVASFVYGPFGELVAQSSSRNCPLLFSSKRYDSETGYTYFGQRYYDSKTTSWLSRDPIREEGGINHYAYCQNNPVGQVDAIGLDPTIYGAKIGKDGEPLSIHGDFDGHGLSYVWNYTFGGKMRYWTQAPTDEELLRLFRLTDDRQFRLATEDERLAGFTEQLNQSLPRAVDRAGQTLGAFTSFQVGTGLAAGGGGLVYLGGRAVYGIVAASWEAGGGTLGGALYYGAPIYGPLVAGGTEAYLYGNSGGFSPISAEFHAAEEGLSPAFAGGPGAMFKGENLGTNPYVVTYFHGTDIDSAVKLLNGANLETEVAASKKN